MERTNLSLIFKEHELNPRYSTNLVVVQSYFRQRSFISHSFGESNDSDERWCGMGVLRLYLLYLRAYISVAIVSRSSLGAEREIDVVTLALQPAVFVPCRCGWQSTFPNCTPQPRNILTVFSRTVAQRRSLRSSARLPGGNRMTAITMSLKYLTLKFQ